MVKKAFVEALATVALTNDLPNGMKLFMVFCFFYSGSI